MKNVILSFLFVFFVTSTVVHAEGFTLSSPDVTGQISDCQVLNGFGCKGKNISPKLKWKNAPKGTKSFAVTVYDPDAPTGSGWWHWVLFDIPANIKALTKNAGNIEAKLAPEGSIQSTTSFGKAGFGGACPPAGDSPHQYIFTVYALKADKLGLDSNAPPAMVGFYLNNNTLAKSSIVSYYSR